MEGFEENFNLNNYKRNQNISLRQYQISLVEKAKKQNTIIYLPTGGGKTMIAMHVLLSRTHEIARSFINGGKRAFFLANTKVLVSQIAWTLQTHTKFKIGYYTGDMNVDSWDMIKWQNEIKSNQVLVVTAEILRQILILKFLDPLKISVIIFDECHHANQCHPYKQIMNFLSDLDQSDMPLIMGLSATLFKSSPKINEIEKLLNALECTYQAKITGGQEWNDAISTTGVATEQLVIYDPVVPSAYINNVLQVYKEAINILNQMYIKVDNIPIPEDGKDFKNRNEAMRIRRHLENARIALEELGSYCGSLAALYYTIILEKHRLMSNDETEVQALIFARTIFHKVRRLLTIYMEGEDNIYQFSAPKVQKMIDLVLDISEKNDSFSAIIFVQKRCTAIILSYLLKRMEFQDSRFKKVKPEFVIGSSIFSKVFNISLQSNEKILKSFATQELNLLCATDVLEEGIDVPSCNTVISFDFPLKYSSYIQSKGRARDRNSNYYIFCKTPTNKQNQIQIIKNWNEVINKVKQLVAKENILFDSSLESPKSEEQIYIITKEGNTKIIDGITAIKCIERYCSFLPQDYFSCLTPITWYKEKENLKKGFLQLPISCPLRQTIEGKECTNLKLAKKSVFLKTVQLLHENGLIDDNLCFINFQKKEDVNYLLPHFKDEQIKNYLPQPGSKKRRRVFNKKFADCLSYCLPKPNENLYLHVIKLSENFNRQVLDRKIIVCDLIKTPNTYGILSTKKLPKICQFPLFLDLGRLNCNILENYDTFLLNAAEITDIKLFHYALFKKVLDVVKNCHIFDNNNEENSFFIVPLQLSETKKFVLNWDIIRSDFCKINSPALVPYNPNLSETNQQNYRNCNSYYNNSDKLKGTENNCQSLSVMNAFRGEFQEEDDNLQKPHFNMSEEEYLNFIISPSYRGISPPQYYCVTACCHNITPLSTFPKEEFNNYYDYYLKKYRKKITNLNQPLLKVTQVIHCSNFNNLSSVGRKAKAKNYQEYFVPELCDIYRFPPDYWVKAQFLPSIINRISHIYLIEELRKTIAVETGLGEPEVPSNFSWEPLVEENHDGSHEDAKATNINEFLTQNLPLSELKNKLKSNTDISVDLERKLFDISLCDLENYMKSILSEKEELFNFERTEEINEVKRLRSSAVPVLKLLNLKKSVRGPELAQLVRAFTSTQAIDIVNYESLEFLGDSFLKFATSFFLFKTFDKAEDFLTIIKGSLVSNKNLMYCALNKNLDKFINVIDFSPLSDWNPPLFCIPKDLKTIIKSKKKDPIVLHDFEIPEEEKLAGSISNETLTKNLNILDNAEEVDLEIQTNSLIQQHVINDKTLADVVESLLGVCISNSGMEGGMDILNWLGIIPKEQTYKKLFDEPYNFQYLEEGNEEKAKMLLEEKLVNSFEEMLGYTFKNKGLLLEALTHPSYIRNRSTLSFQRLEFIGDAVLDFLVTAYIYEYYGPLSAGQITDIRMAVVNNITFGCLSVKYDFHKYLFSMSQELNKCIEGLVKFQISRNHTIRENVLLLQEESNCIMAEAVTVPKALGDIFESIAGAIFLDSGNSLETVWEIYYTLLKPVLDDFKTNVPKSSMRLLCEICGEKPNFNISDHSTFVMAVCTLEFQGYKITVHGFGKNKKDAQLSASKFALKKILEIKK